MPLTPQTYDAAEAEAMIDTPNRLIESVRPTAFAEVGYPVRVSDTRSLRRYVEVMHEVRLPQVTQFLGGGLRADEAPIFRQVVNAVAEMSERDFGERRVPYMSLLDAFNIKRHIDYLYPDRRPRALEIGAGSGYVGAVLVAGGHSYVGTDITQAFYLHQSHLLNQLTAGSFSEGVVASVGAPATVAHLPWWQFYRPDGRPDIGAEIITANHCICEMHPHAAAYIFHLTARLLSETRTGALIFFSLGSQILRLATEVLASMQHFGLRLAHNDEQITVVVGPAHPLYDQCPSIDVGALPPSTELPIVVAQHAIGRAIVDGRAATRQSIALSMKGIEDILLSAFGRSELLTEDQRFLDFAALP